MFYDLLKEGSRKEVARANEVAAQILDTPPLIDSLLDCLCTGDETVRAHAAHALMQVGKQQADILHPVHSRLLKEIAPIQQWEVQEQLMKVLPLIDTSDQVVQLAKRNLSHKSAIVRTCALQALFDLVQRIPNRFNEVMHILQDCQNVHAPKSLQARARKLSAKMKDLKP